MNSTPEAPPENQGRRLFRTTIMAAAALAATACGGNGGRPALLPQQAALNEAVACETLAGTSLAGGSVVSAVAVPAGFVPPGPPVSGLPAFCRVTVLMKPSNDSNVNVEVWMPRQNWNGRFLGTGNGGGGGSLTYMTGMVEGLKRGFAVANNDLGTAPDPNDQIGHPERWADFGFRANHFMTVASKSIIAAYYNSAPRSSYFEGCSTGGQQALSLAQRYPTDYNGIIAGAAAQNRTHLHTMFLRNLQALNAPGAKLSPEKLNMVTSKVLAACVGKDGGAPTDTFLTDPRQCNFDPETLPKCTASDDATCLTAPQLSALKTAWAGPINPRTGERIFTGTPIGAESAVFGLAFQSDTVSWPSQQLYMFKWAFGPTWDYSSFDFDQGMDTVDALLAPSLNANNADLSAFRAAGGKLMMYTGTTDPGVPFSSNLEYYERAIDSQGGNLAATQDYFRYYLIPGMGHCSSITGGPGVGDFGQPYSSVVPKDAEHDILLKLVDWFENNRAPESFTAVKYADPSAATVAMERPICSYPKIPTYIGGDPSKAASFECRDAPRNNVAAPAKRYLN